MPPRWGYEREATVMFADLRGFTTWAEDRKPASVLHLINQYMPALTREIARHGGSVDKYLGDGLMAVFESDESGPQTHAIQAVRAAMGMQAAVVRLAAELTRQGSEPLEVGIGIETGTIAAGSVGTAERAEFTVLGDVVNLASRLTAVAEPGEIVLGPGAAAEVSGSADLEAMGALSIRGRRETVEAFTVRGLNGTASAETGSVVPFPREQQAHAGSETGPGGPRVKPEQLLVLLADDDPQITRMLDVMFATDGREILVARDGDEALALIRARHPHLAIMDVQMPGLNGIEVTAAVKSDPTLADVRIILLTGSRSEEVAQAAAAAGVDWFTRKPFSPLALLRYVESANFPVREKPSGIHAVKE